MAHNPPNLTKTGPIRAVRPRTDRSLAGTNLARAGDYNRRIVLQAIRAHDEMTRSELTALTGLSHQSVVNISRWLLGEGLILDIGPLPGARGQTGSRLAVNPDGAYALGLNIDRDHITLVVMDFRGKVRARRYFDCHFALPDQVLDLVRHEIDDILRRRLIPKTRLIGVGVAIPERLGGVEVAERPAAYDAWTDYDVVGHFSRHLGLPVYSENDATSAAIGELQFGEGLNYRSFVYTLISAGIGCGLIINGQPYRGGLYHAGEIGNIPLLTQNGTRNLWDVVSLYALYDDLAQRGIAVSRPEDLKQDDNVMSAAIDRWAATAAGHMAGPFLALNYFLSPQMHFIGGQLPAFVAEKLCWHLNIAMTQSEGKLPLTRFRTSSHAMDAAAMGAAVLVFQNRLLPMPEVLMTPQKIG